MKNKIILILVIMAITLGFLSGCTETKNLSEEEKRFIGTWTANSENFQILMTFNPDRTFKQSFIERNWEIKDGLLVLTGETDLETSSYNYYFSENDTILNLQTVGTDVYVPYTKQIE